MEINKIYQGDSLRVLNEFPDNFVDLVVTSPPYWGLRNYESEEQLGAESSPEEFIEKLFLIFQECGRVLKPTGTMFINLGDTFNGNKVGNTETNKNKAVVTDSFKKERVKSIADKSLLMIPERFAIKMIDNGWVLRNQIIWHKPNQMPQSATDRFTVDFEKIFFFAKQSTGYFFDDVSIREDISASVMNDSRLMKEGYSTGRPERGYPGENQNGGGLLSGRSIQKVATRPISQHSLKS